jgi:hypothetical protein
MTVELQTELASMLDPLDLPGDWTQRQRNDYEGKRAALQAKIREAEARATARMQAAMTWASLEQEISAATTWRTFLTTTRQTLCDELLAIRGRTREDRDLQDNLKLSIISIDKGLQSLDGAACFTLRSIRLGELLIAGGYLPTDQAQHRQFGGLPWRGSLPQVERELVLLTKQRDAASARLAELSVSAEEQAQRRAEQNARPTRKTRADGSQYDKFPDGTIVEIEEAPV